MFQPCNLLPALVGYLTLFGVVSCTLKSGRRLQFEPCAFDESLRSMGDDIYAVLDHESHTEKFASTGRNTLLFDADSRGVWCVILPRNDEFGRIAVSLVASGHADKMSVSVSYPERCSARTGDIDIVRDRVWILEASVTGHPAMEGTELCVAVDSSLPSTPAELRAERDRLCRENLRQEMRGRLLHWKIQKAAQRAALLESLRQPELVA